MLNCLQVTLWDTGGQERYDSMTANYYRSAHAVILVYALDEEGTLYSLNEWVGEAKAVNRLGDRLVLAAWGTKSDLPSYQLTVKEDAVDALLELYHIPNHLSCKVNVFDGSVDEAMLSLVEHVHKQFSGTSTSSDHTRDLSEIISDTSTKNKRPCCRFSS